MNGLNVLNNEITMTSVDVVELINNFRTEEGNRKELRHDNFIASIRKEVKSLKNVGISTNLNFKESSYNDGLRNYNCFELNKEGIMQMLNKESALVIYMPRLLYLLSHIFHTLSLHNY